MVKSVKAIILASVMVSMSMMLINSCGVSSPTSSTGNTGVSGLSTVTGGCVPSVPGMPDPSIYLPTGISSDAAKALLENPYANPNASGTPINYSCGTYTHGQRYVGGTSLANGSTISAPSPTCDAKGIYTYYTVHYTFITGPNYYISDNATVVSFSSGNFLPALPPDSHFTIPCGDPLLGGTNLPPNMFAGNGYPDGDYVIGGDWFSLAGGKATWKGRATPCTPDGARPKKPPVVASLTITPQDVSIGANKTTQFSIVGTMSDGTPANPAVINKGTVNWVSSDASIAVVYNGGTSGGQAWGKSKGTVDIWAEHNGIKSNVAKLHVGNQLQSISVSPASATIYIHSQPNSITYTASGSFSDGTTKSPLSPVTWDTLPGGIANIDGTGKAIAVSPGTTYITAASTADGTTITSGTYDAELCVECFKYTHYRQNRGQPWSGNPLAYHRYDDVTITIGRRGCAVTSAAMALTATGTPVDPGQLEQWLFDNGGFAKDNTIKWWKAAQYPGSHLSNWHSIPASGVTQTLQNCQVVIVSVNNSILPQHWVILVKEKNGRYLMYDPWKYTQSDPTPNLSDLLNIYNIQYGYYTYDVK